MAADFTDLEWPEMRSTGETLAKQERSDQQDQPNQSESEQSNQNNQIRTIKSEQSCQILSQISAGFFQNADKELVCFWEKSAA